MTSTPWPSLDGGAGVDRNGGRVVVWIVPGDQVDLDAGDLTTQLGDEMDRRAGVWASVRMF